MNEYWRDRLDNSGKDCYSRILGAVRKQRSDIDCGSVDVEIANEAYLAVYYDHPELFYMSNSPAYTRMQGGLFGIGMMNFGVRVKADPIYSANEIRSCEAKIEAIKTDLKKKITSRTTDEDKVVLVADYLVQNTDYEINNQFNQNAASSLCFGKAQCSGYSKAFKLLMDELGVYCICVDGEGIDHNGVGGPHAWNLVRIDGNYYHVDVTFMEGANIQASDRTTRMYLFYDDKMIAKNHKWDKSRLPACTDGSKYINDHTAGPLDQLKRMVGQVRSSIPEKGPHYTSLSQLRTELKTLIKQREKQISFYLDIGIESREDIASAAKNALEMALTKENITASASVSVAQGAYVTININY